MSHLESIASSAVRAAIKVKASVIICFTSFGRAARLIAKYRPTMPVLSVVIPRLKTNQLKWSFSGAFEARQSLIVRGLFPMLADPRHPFCLKSQEWFSSLMEKGHTISFTNFVLVLRLASKIRIENLDLDLIDLAVKLIS
ncbi:Pyruvate kinase 2, cytosolic [Camellia lanceoleosa]|uniref:Pyruvate kinase 2, cytosolic n=1 Tax=Camellia lanceoleosa TaxID=1840588 RepID=A0ACC0I7D1_9ERIC|nr:Pyruvate kinase 2, cytosolic [Camellia lanceoleosa]